MRFYTFGGALGLASGPPKKRSQRTPCDRDRTTMSSLEEIIDKKERRKTDDHDDHERLQQQQQQRRRTGNSKNFYRIIYRYLERGVLPAIKNVRHVITQ
jgi:hypothetical protein